MVDQLGFHLVLSFVLPVAVEFGKSEDNVGKLVSQQPEDGLVNVLLSNNMRQQSILLSGRTALLHKQTNANRISFDTISAYLYRSVSCPAAVMLLKQSTG